jgi:glucose uptake protein GlcU
MKAIKIAGVSKTMPMSSVMQLCSTTLGAAFIFGD